MSRLTRTPFGAVFQTEVLLNSKRVAPYVMMALFGANAWLWWAKGAATFYGWAANGDFFIIRNFIGFSFLTLPLFTALMMGDPVIRDFRAGVDPLILSKPVGRASYLLGKFFGNYFVLVCCQAVFALALVLFQAFRPAGMVVQPARLSRACCSSCRGAEAKQETHGRVLCYKNWLRSGKSPFGPSITRPALYS